ncbi:hypothetical protein [uncultured Clostridium sp.]|jgi:hypothetical protein|uniref:hypothetical protein n=1 Tax=uncultured Clostridium sp. TaxID=59620 RepID=UPI0025F1534A|nr:hypothetical protein [uncultured Clostridium sp.]
MEKKIIIIFIIVMIAMVLDDIFSSLELVWYIKLLPFAIVVVGYFIILFKSRLNKNDN